MHKLLGTFVVRTQKNTKMAKIALIVPFVLIAVLALATVPVRADSTKIFIALLNGGQEVPPTDSPAFGVAFMTFNDATKELCFSISFTELDLVAAEIAAHFHVPAAPGQVADPVFPLSLGSPKNGCIGPLNNQQRKDLKKGLFYVNVHSVDFPGGEIRGQVLRIKK